MFPNQWHFLGHCLKQTPDTKFFQVIARVEGEIEGAEHFIGMEAGIKFVAG